MISMMGIMTGIAIITITGIIMVTIVTIMITTVTIMVTTVTITVTTVTIMVTIDIITIIDIIDTEKLNRKWKHRSSEVMWQAGWKGRGVTVLPASYVTL